MEEYFLGKICKNNKFKKSNSNLNNQHVISDSNSTNFFIEKYFAKIKKLNY